MYFSSFIYSPLSCSSFFSLLILFADCTMRLSFIPDINASLVGFAYPSEMIKAEWQDLALKRHMFHIPKTVSAERFYKPPNPSEKTPASLVEAVTAYDKARDIDVLFISAMHQWVYPVRWKVCLYSPVTSCYLLPASHLSSKIF